MGKSLEFLELDFYDPNKSLIAISFGSVDFRNISQRKGTFSKTIEMPSTKVNDAFFGMAFDPSNTGNFDDKTRVPIIISEIEFTGTLQLKSASTVKNRPVSYSVNIFSDLADWASLIGEGSIRSLKHHESHNLTKDTVIASWSNSGSSGNYVYPLINYGNFLQDKPQDTDLELALWRPAFFTLPLIKQIFKEAGYSFIDKGFIGAGFKNHILAFTSKEVKLDEFRIDADTNNSDPVSFNNTSKFPTSMRKTVNFLNKTSSNPLSNFFNHLNGVFIPPSTDTYDISLNGYQIHVQSTGGKQNEVIGTARLVYLPIGHTGPEFDISPPREYISSVTAVSNLFTLSGSVSVPLVRDKPYGVAIRFEMDGETSVFASLVTVLGAGSLGDPLATSISIVPRSPTLIEGSTIDHSKFIQNIKKIDLINDVITMGNFRIVTDTINKTVEFIERDKFLLNSKEDWSDKVDHSRHSTVSHIQNEGPKELVWEYSNDSSDGFITDITDRFDEEYGSEKIILSSDYRKGSKTVHKSIFSSTIDGHGMGISMPVMSTQQIKQDEPIEAGVFETNFENRCLLYSGLRVGRIYIQGERQGSYPYAFFAGDNISLHYGKHNKTDTSDKKIGLIGKFHKSTINQLDTSKLLSTWVDLTELDISNLSFRKIKIIEGVHYHLNLVKDYIVNGNQSTMVELISK